MADKDVLELFRGLLSDIQDDDARALQASLQPQVLASQAANVPVPLAPPPTYNVVPGVGVPPAVDVGQIGISQPAVGAAQNRGSAMAGLGDRQAQFEAAQRSRDFGTAGGPYQTIVPGEETLEGFPTMPGRDGTLDDVLQETFGEPYDPVSALGLNRPLIVPPVGGADPIEQQEDVVVSALGIPMASSPAAIGSAVPIPDYEPQEYFGSGRLFESDSTSGDDGFTFTDLLKSRPVGYQKGIRTDLIPEDIDVKALQEQLEQEDASDREALVSGELSLRRYKIREEARRRQLTTAQNKKKDFDKNKTNLLTARANELEEAGLTEEAERVRAQITPEVPKTEGDGIPEPATTGTQPAATGTQPAATGTQPATTGTDDTKDKRIGVVTEEDAKSAEESVDANTAEQVDNALEETGKTKPRPSNDSSDEEKEGFLKSLWSGVRGLFKEGFEDPALRKTLIAYIGSKALGYDGATFAAQVLENEYQKEAKAKELAIEQQKELSKRQFELDKIGIEAGIKARDKFIKDKTIDPFKRTHVIHNGVKIEGALSSDGSIFQPDNPTDFPPTSEGTYPAKYDMRALRASDQYKVEGASRQDNISSLTNYVVGRKQGVIQEVLDQEAPNLDSDEEKKLKARLSAATSDQTYKTASVAFIDMMGDVDFSGFDVESVYDQAHLQYLKDVAKGGTMGGKTFAAYLNLFHLKNTAANRVSDQFFMQNRESKEMMAIGLDSWAEADRAANKFRQALAAEYKSDPKNMSMPQVWHILEKAFNKQAAEQGENFLQYWEGKAKQSVKQGPNKQASPAILWATSIGRTPKQNAKFFPGSMKEFLKNFKQS